MEIRLSLRLGLLLGGGLFGGSLGSSLFSLSGALSLDVLGNGFFLLGGLTSSFLLISGGLLGSTESLELLVDSLFLSVDILLSSSFSLFSELLLSDLLLLHLVDGFNQDRLVLELVTLGGQVEVMVAIDNFEIYYLIFLHIFSNFLGISVLPKETSKNTLSSHPQDLLWHSGVLGTLSFTVTGVTTCEES